MLFLILVMTGCHAPVLSSKPITAAVSTKEPSLSAIATSEELNGKRMNVTKYLGEKNAPVLAAGFGFYGEHYFRGISPGYQGAVAFTLVNGLDDDRELGIAFRIPDIKDIKVAGDLPLPKEYLSWFSCAISSASLTAGTSYELPILVTVPKKEELQGGDYELRIRVVNLGRGFISLAPESVWYINVIGE